MKESRRIYGLMAEFETPTNVVAAARSAYEEGYRSMDAFSPYPIEELSEAIGFHRNRLPLIVLIGGIIGCVGGFALCYWASVFAYPLNIGGRPLNSWPSFIPVTFECTILVAALSAVFGMLALNGLPQPYHPVFNVEGFETATRDHFFLCIESKDPRFDLDATRAFLQSLGPKEVKDVEF
jgi:ActD protein